MEGDVNTLPPKPHPLSKHEHKNRRARRSSNPGSSRRTVSPSIASLVNPPPRSNPNPNPHPKPDPEPQPSPSPSPKYTNPWLSRQSSPPSRCPHHHRLFSCLGSTPKEGSCQVLWIPTYVTAKSSACTTNTFTLQHRATTRASSPTGKLGQGKHIPWKALPLPSPAPQP